MTSLCARLPDELLLEVLRRLPHPRDVCHAEAACTRLLDICRANESALWARLLEQLHRALPVPHEGPRETFRRLHWPQDVSWQVLPVESGDLERTLPRRGGACISLGEDWSTVGDVPAAAHSAAAEGMGAEDAPRPGTETCATVLVFGGIRTGPESFRPGRPSNALTAVLLRQSYWPGVPSNSAAGDEGSADAGAPRALVNDRVHCLALSPEGTLPTPRWGQSFTRLSAMRVDASGWQSVAVVIGGWGGTPEDGSLMAPWLLRRRVASGTTPRGANAVADDEWAWVELPIRAGSLADTPVLRAFHSAVEVMPGVLLLSGGLLDDTAPEQNAVWQLSIGMDDDLGGGGGGQAPDAERHGLSAGARAALPSYARGAEVGMWYLVDRLTECSRAGASTALLPAPPQALPCHLGTLVIACGVTRLLAGDRFHSDAVHVRVSAPIVGRMVRLQVLEAQEEPSRRDGFAAPAGDVGSAEDGAGAASRTQLPTVRCSASCLVGTKLLICGGYNGSKHALSDALVLMDGPGSQEVTNLRVLDKIRIGRACEGAMACPLRGGSAGVLVLGGEGPPMVNVNMTARLLHFVQ